MKLQKIFAAVVAGALAASAMVAAAYAGEKTLSEVQYTGIKVTGTFEAGSAISGTERLKIKITDKNGLTITTDEAVKTAITAKTIAKAANIEATFSLDSGKASASKLEGMKFEISYSVDGTADPAVYTKIDVPMTKELQGADYVAPASWTLNSSVISDKDVKMIVDADEGLTVTVNHKKADAGKEIKYKVDGGAEVTKSVAKDATSTVIEIKPEMVDVNVFSGLVTRKNPTFEITGATVDEITSVVLSWEDEAPATEAPTTEPTDTEPTDTEPADTEPAVTEPAPIAPIAPPASEEPGNNGGGQDDSPNPGTGAALALIPTIIAGAASVISKRK